MRCRPTHQESLAVTSTETTIADGIDYLFWAGNYGLHASTSVPEPGTLGLLAVGMLPLVCRRPAANKLIETGGKSQTMLTQIVTVTVVVAIARARGICQFQGAMTRHPGRRRLSERSRQTTIGICRPPCPQQSMGCRLDEPGRSQGGGCAQVTQGRAEAGAASARRKKFQYGTFSSQRWRRQEKTRFPSSAVPRPRIPPSGQSVLPIILSASTVFS